MSHQYLFTAAAILLLPQVILSGASVRGTVIDPQGQAIDGAEVRLFRGGASAGRTITRQGSFSFSDVGEGDALLEISAEGFRRITHGARSGVDLRIVLPVAGVDQRIVVTAEDVPQDVDQIAKPLSVIPAEELRQRNEYSLTEAIRDIPGAVVRNLGGPVQGSSIRMRGLRADATAILVDGMRFRDAATLQGDASSFLGAFPVVAFDRVEVLRGSGASLYGTNSVGGTVNVITDPGGGTLHGNAQLEGGNLGFLRGRGGIAGGALDQRLHYSAGLSHLNVMSGIDGDDRARVSAAQGFARYFLRPETTVRGRLFATDDFAQLNTSPSTSGIPAANLPASGIIPGIALDPEQTRFSGLGLAVTPGAATFVPNRNDPDSRRASRSTNTALQLRHEFSTELAFEGNWQHLHTRRDARNGPAGPGFQPLVSNLSRFTGGIQTADARLAWRPSRRFALTGGYEWERETYENLDDNREPAPTTVRTRTDASQRAHAGYFASQSSLAGDRLHISLSGRLQNFRLSTPRFDYAGAAATYRNSNAVTPPRALTGDAAVAYFLRKSGTKLRVHGGNAYRAPALYERYGTGFYYDSFSSGVAFSPYGDPRLAPDRYNTLDAGVDQYLAGERIRLSATWFYIRSVQQTQFDFSGFAVRFDTDPYGRFSGYYNGGGGISRGVEFTAEAKPRRGTAIRASYAHANADTDAATGVPGVYRALGVPSHTVHALVHQELGRRTSVTADLYHSGSYLAPLFAGSGSRAFRMGGVTKVDTVVGHDLRRGEKTTPRGYLKLENMLNQRYYENGFQAPRATVLTGLELVFR